MKIFRCPNCNEIREFPTLLQFSCLHCGLWFKNVKKAPPSPTVNSSLASPEPSPAAAVTTGSPDAHTPIFNWDVEAAMLLRFLNQLLPPAARAAAYDRLKAGLQAAMVFRLKEWAAMERAAFMGRSGPSKN